MKKIIIGICLLTLITGCGEKKKETKQDKPQEEMKVNTNENVIKDQKVEEFEFTNTSIIYQDGTSTFETTVTNTSAETSYLSEFKIHVKDKDGNEMVDPVMIGFIGEQIPSNESRVITSYSLIDLSNAVTVEYEIVR